MHAHPPQLPPARRRPRAAAPVVLTLGQVVQINGMLFTVGPGLIPQGAAPTPTPLPTPPPAPALAGYKNAATGQMTTTAAPGDLLLLMTENLPALIPGASGRVILGSTEAVVLSWSPAEVEIKVPPAPAGPVVVKLYYQANPSANPQLLIGAGPPLAITAPPPVPQPTPLPAGTGPNGHYWLRHDGAAVTVAHPGEELTLLGDGFGGAIGRVWFAGIEQRIVSWTDTRITFTLNARASGAVRQWYIVRRADGAAGGSGPVPFVVQMP